MTVTCSWNAPEYQELCKTILCNYIWFLPCDSPDLTSSQRICVACMVHLARGCWRDKNHVEISGSLEMAHSCVARATKISPFSYPVLSHFSHRLLLCPLAWSLCQLRSQGNNWCWRKTLLRPSLTLFFERLLHSGGGIFSLFPLHCLSSNPLRSQLAGFQHAWAFTCNGKWTAMGYKGGSD